MRALALALVALSAEDQPPSFSTGRQEGKLDLRWSLPQGRTLRVRLVQRLAVAAIDLEVRDLLHLSVTEVDAKGEASIAAKYEGAGIKAAGSPGVEYDSEKDKEPPAHAYARAVAKLVGRSFTFRLTPDGRVTEVKGFEAILQEVLKGAGEQDEAIARQFLRQMLSDDIMRSKLQQMSPGLPPGPVGPGDGWSNEFALRVPVLGAIKILPASKLVELKDREAKIEQTLGLEQPADTDALFLVKGGKGSSTAFFSAARGAFRSVELALEIRVLSPAGSEVPLKLAFRMEALR
jgi:hypothetical protein